MEFVKDKEVDRIYCKDDPELWVLSIRPDQRLDLPFRFIVAIEGRAIGLASGKTLSGTPYMEDQQGSARPLLVIRIIGLHVRVMRLSGANEETNASKFASRAQQNRAVEFFLRAIEHTHPWKHVTGEILPPQARFAPEIEAGLHSGAFIEA